MRAASTKSVLAAVTLVVIGGAAMAVQLLGAKNRAAVEG